MRRTLSALLLLAFALSPSLVAAKPPLRKPTPRFAKQGPLLFVKTRGFVSIQRRWSRALRARAIQDALQKAVKQVTQSWVPSQEWKTREETLAALWNSRNAPLFVAGYLVLSERRVGTLYSVQLKVSLLHAKLRKEFEKLKQESP